MSEPKIEEEDMSETKPEKCESKMCPIMRDRAERLCLYEPRPTLASNDLAVGCC